MTFLFGLNVLEKNVRLSKITPFADCAYGHAGWHCVQVDPGGGSHHEVDASLL
jgi:hypothetical protein